MTHPAENFTSKCALILAAGKGTRMKSDLPKVLHPFLGKPLLFHVLDSLVNAGLNEAVLVLGFKHELVREQVAVWQKNHSPMQLQFVIQEPQLGTGHAVMCAEKMLKADGHTIVLLGDVPLLQPDTICQAFDSLKPNSALVISTVLEDPTGYGRIIRNSDETAARICEEKDASPELRQIKEINSGIFVFQNRQLLQNLSKLNTNNAQKEYYLTDLVEIYHSQGHAMKILCSEDSLQFTGVNSVEQLASLEEEYQRRGVLA